jgi:Ni2+-binding GTPase involved in maturation of urease and hydrogenase
MIGGFLGAGKTTTIGRLARSYQEQGLNVGIVTNDQAEGLVDTHTLRSQGFSVGEVAGSCFCCNFNELTAVTRRLSEDQQPDVVLAEPVGSCTDLVATVVQPLLQLHSDQFEVAPYGVILKPSHGLRILRASENAGFSPQAAYIFEKQLEEADFIIVNRIDQLAPEEVDELVGLIESRCPGVPVLRMSALTGAGFDGFLELLDQQGNFGRRILDLDYDIYAAGEAELGWLNATVRVTAEAPIVLDDLLVRLIQQLREVLNERSAETAHLKVIGLWEGYYGVANLVSGEAQPQLSLASDCQTQQTDLVINARVACDPDILQELVQSQVQAVCQELSAQSEFLQCESFRPGRPVPTHRLSTSSQG